MDSGLNAGFFVLHSAWIVLTCLGWIWKRTRRWQLAAVTLTALSWFGLGVWYGWGYCPCTDWHWQVRARLGYSDPPSYVELLIRQVTGIELGTDAANVLTLVVFLAAAVMGVVMWRKDRAAG